MINRYKVQLKANNTWQTTIYAYFKDTALWYVEQKINEYPYKIRIIDVVNNREIKEKYRPYKHYKDGHKKRKEVKK